MIHWFSSVLARPNLWTMVGINPMVYFEGNFPTDSRAKFLERWGNCFCWRVSQQISTNTQQISTNTVPSREQVHIPPSEKEESSSSKVLFTGGDM